MQSSVGPLLFGYFTALKSLSILPEDDRQQYRQLFSATLREHALIAGDINSTPRAIQLELDQAGLSRSMFNFPTYLFPAPNLDSPSNLPCFDNVIWDTSRLDNVQAEPTIKLPRTVSTNPRSLIDNKTILSDHVPISIQARKDGQHLRALSFNVADPLLWGQMYPGAKVGFNQHTEQQRQDELFSYIRSLSGYDYLFLQEVPGTLVERLELAFSDLQSIDMASDMIDPRISSKIVLISL